MKQLLWAAAISLPLLVGCGNAEKTPDWNCHDSADFTQSEKSAAWNVERTMEDKVVRVCAILDSSANVRTNRFFFKDGRFVESAEVAVPASQESK